MKYPSIWPQFFTLSIRQKFELLKNYNYRISLFSMLKSLIDDYRLDLTAFIVMGYLVHKLAHRQAGLATFSRLYPER